MKGISITAFLIIICLPNYSQELRGIVIDENTKRPLTDVSVFFNGTTRGTKTDRNGNFKVLAPENQKLPLAVSAIGYNSLLLTEYPADKSLKILLVPKIYELNEVVIISKRSLWEKSIRNNYLNTFRRQFIGETVNAYTCKIMNESDLVFQYDENRLLLTAYSLRPLIISNKSLGYQITFYLDAFEYSQIPYSLSYTGYYNFREDSTLNSKERVRAENRRRLAFLGSRMHLMRSLWENNLDSAGFTIKNSDNKIITYDSLVVERDSSDKYMGSKRTYNVAYLSKTSRSMMEITKNNVYFNKLGYFDPYGIKWIGEMGKQRVADLLPYDYIKIKH
ncbi:MAG: hypothetical protein A2V64_05075 [Bacteroidetes bacterium RBG_13_43_22]|nr:MAG: hypothetical protein A2V64_05075 [Bacteroidetes bacterium RBG_13_43_22]